MPIDSEALSLLASEYANGMTSIRGRRVQRLLKREFAGAEYVVLAEFDSGAAAVLGLSPTGAALCATNRTGKQASVVKWSYESAVALETLFDLHKDSLPILGTESVPLARLRAQARLRVPTGSVPLQARLLVSNVLQVLA
jgi:hypothetical protein